MNDIYSLSKCSVCLQR